MPTDYMERIMRAAQEEAGRHRRGFSIDTLIMLPYHLRYYLPNRDFAYNGVLFGNDIKCSVIRLSDMRTLESATFKLDNERWEEAVAMFQALAWKKYPKPLRNKEREKRDELFRSKHRDSRW